MLPPFPEVNSHLPFLTGSSTLVFCQYFPYTLLQECIKALIEQDAVQC